MSQSDIAWICGLSADDVDLHAAGLNHFQWVLAAFNNKTGEDVYPLLKEKEKDFDSSFLPLTRQIFNTYGYWVTCSDDHLGEYIAWGYEAGEAGFDFDGAELRRHRMQAEIGEITSGEMDTIAWLTPSGEKAMDVIAAITTGKRVYLPSAIVLNDGAITNLPNDIAVEIPVYLDGAGLHKVHIGDLPAGPRSLLSGQIGSQIMSVEAAVHGSREMAMQALLCDPVINSSVAADKILDELWEINKDYIRRCWK